MKLQTPIKDLFLKCDLWTHWRIQGKETEYFILWGLSFPLSFVFEGKMDQHLIYHSTDISIYTELKDSENSDTLESSMLFLRLPKEVLRYNCLKQTSKDLIHKQPQQIHGFLCFNYPFLLTGSTSLKHEQRSEGEPDFMFRLHYSEKRVIITEVAEACMVVCLYK